MNSNAYNDDLPYKVNFKNKSIIVIPYAFDTNDMRYEFNGGFVQSDDFLFTARVHLTSFY